MKRLISALLVLLMIVPLASSCGILPTDSLPSYEYAPNRAGVADTIPTNLRFDGENVVFLVRHDEPFGREAITEKITGDVLNDAVYNRDRTVCERFGIKTEYRYATDPEQTMDTSVMSGLDEYQIVGATSHHLIESGIAGNLYNVLNEDRFPYLDFERPWWSSYYIENAQIYNQLYTLVGDISLTWLMFTYVVFFNKTIAAEAGLPDLYALVKDGKWTVDKLIEYSELVYNDVTGDGKTDDDVFGFGFDTCDMIDPFWSAFDLSIMSVDDDGEPYIDIDLDRHKTVLDKLYGMMYENKAIVCVKASTLEDNISSEEMLSEKMAKDELLFAELSLSQCDKEWLRSMNNDYGVIPMPKWDEAQKEYYSFTDEWHTIWGIPVTVRRTDLVSAVLEAFAAESYRYVTPAYYNDVLNGRYMRDLESSEMLDYITAHNKTTFALIYSVPMKRLSHDLLRNILGDRKSTNIASFWRGSRKMYEKALERMLSSVEKNIKAGK